MASTLAAPALHVTDEPRATLRSLARSTSLSDRTVVRAKALLLCAEGEANYEVARRLDKPDLTPFVAGDDVSRRKVL